jgi:hypothetical protein
MKVVKDCIHGYIKLSELAVKYIDQSEFQRLRRVKQLGNVSRVYPSATHTRFEHSLGVYHLAGEMCDQLQVEPEYKELIQLAGLYHDVGHLPYSHLFDKILEKARIKDVIPDHESRSVKTFEEVSKRIGILEPWEVEFVCACIMGYYLPGNPRHLFEIVNSTIDVDKLDYLCRDAYHTGMPSFQAKYIIINSSIIQKDVNNLDDTCIGFRKKAFEDIKDLFETRRRMHELVYQHPVSLEHDTIYMKMVLDIIGQIDPSKIKTLCDYTLDSLLLNHPYTFETFNKMEMRLKNEILDSSSIELMAKHIPDSGDIHTVTWI